MTLELDIDIASQHRRILDFVKVLDDQVEVLQSTHVNRDAVHAALLELAYDVVAIGYHADTESDGYDPLQMHCKDVSWTLIVTSFRFTENPCPTTYLKHAATLSNLRDSLQF
ncbi:uncharacterized protein N7506_004160 [Penicillium brevicompactum]|uniref:uncharacterized protein n=1 Tax=Penicillium brevicompactum TaxID=5074 RepID=UPI00254065FD|nr:uncharacterized protein N7506_004160 [Penicillium brevicompactum]KAJ5336138.1 hypothetical protein N7506_004160 [Penicillium brevicompactum]